MSVDADVGAVGIVVIHVFVGGVLKTSTLDIKPSKNILIFSSNISMYVHPKLLSWPY